MLFLSIYVNLVKITMCEGVLVAGLKWPGYLLGVAIGVKGVDCSFGR